MKLRIENEFSGLYFSLFKTSLKKLARSYKAYHPVILGSERLADGERICLDRWRVIEGELEATEIRTLLDLGCAEGYFVQQAARRPHCIALGVDADVRRLITAQNTGVLNKSYRAGFMLAEITLEFIENLPKFDVVLFLSVMHHIMYEHGEEHAREILRTIKRKVNKVLFFDMGQSDEASKAWAEQLPDMGPDPHAWIHEFLLSAGFASVSKVGDTDAHRSSVNRALFLARV